MRVATSGKRRDSFVGGWRGPFLRALLFPALAALVAAGFQDWFESWPTWLGRTSPWLAMIGLVWLLFVQFRKKRVATLYAIEALDQRMLSWHRTAEDASRDKHLDYRPIYRPLKFPPGNGPVDLTAEMEELRRSFEAARQTDDESTGMTVASNMLWPAALFLGFMTPYPPETVLAELAGGPSKQDLEYELGGVEPDSPAFSETAVCGCDVEVVADAVDPSTGERQQPSNSGGCADGGVKFLSIEVTGLLDWPGPSLLGMMPCCATRLVTRITAPCVAHAGRSYCSIRFASSRSTSILEKQSVNTKNTTVQVPSDHTMPMSVWLSERLLEESRDKSHAVLVRTRLPKVMGLSLGAHLRGHASRELVGLHHGSEDVWGSLLLVDHPHPDPPRLVRVHPCQPSFPTVNDEGAVDA